VGLYFYLLLEVLADLVQQTLNKAHAKRVSVYTLFLLYFTETAKFLKARTKANAFLYISYFALFSAFFYTIRNNIRLQKIPLHNTVKIRIIFEKAIFFSFFSFDIKKINIFAGIKIKMKLTVVHINLLLLLASCE